LKSKALSSFEEDRTMTKAEILEAIMNEVKKLKAKNKDYTYIAAQAAGMIKAFKIMKVLTRDELDEIFDYVLGEI